MTRYNRVLLWVAAFYTMALFVVSNLPTKRLPKALLINGADKLEHVVAFAVLTILLLEGTAAKGSARRILLVTAAVLGTGALIELTQSFFGRTCAFTDWLAGVGGFLPALGGWAVVRFLTARRKRKAVAAANHRADDDARTHLPPSLPVSRGMR